MSAHLAAAALVLAQATTQPTPAAPPAPCVTIPQMSAMMTVFAPELVEALGSACEPYLVADAFLIARRNELVSRWRTEGAGQREAAYSGVTRLMLGAQDSDASGSSRNAEAMQVFERNVADRIVPMLTPNLCKRISRLVESLAPLPATNVGMFVGAILGIGEEVDPSGSGGPPICRS